MHNHLDHAVFNLLVDAMYRCILCYLLIIPIRELKYNSSVSMFLPNLLEFHIF